MRLVLCDDNKMLGEALAAVLQSRGHEAVAVTTSAYEGVAAVAAHRPDACVMDLRFPGGGDGLGAARTILECYPETAVLLLSGYVDPAVSAEAMRIGVAGLIGKDQNIDRIAQALDQVAAGDVVFEPAFSRNRPSRPAHHAGVHPLSVLTPREKEVLRRIADGQGTAQMAQEMHITTSTLRTYVKNMLAKLGAHSRLEALALASRVAQPDDS